MNNSKLDVFTLKACRIAGVDFDSITEDEKQIFEQVVNCIVGANKGIDDFLLTIEEIGAKIKNSDASGLEVHSINWAQESGACIDNSL